MPKKIYAFLIVLILIGAGVILLMKTKNNLTQNGSISQTVEESIIKNTELDFSHPSSSFSKEKIVASDEDEAKKIAERVISAFFEAIKKKGETDSYWIDLASQKDRRDRELICDEFNLYKVEVPYDILQRATINKIINELDKYDKVKVQEVEPAGSSYMDVKVCDTEGLCKFFHLDVGQNDDGNWIVNLDDNDLIEQEDVKDIHQTTTKKPGLAVKEFFAAFKNEEYTKVVDLLDDERFKYYKDKGDVAAGEALKRSYVNHIIKISDYLSFDKIEILSEDTKEKMLVKTVLWKEEGLSEEKSFILIKTQGEDWRIMIDVNCINEEELNL